MTTGLAVVDLSKYPALASVGAVQSAAMANIDAGESLSERDLTLVMMPTAGATRWIVPTLTGEEAVESIAGLLVWRKKRGVVWPSMEQTKGQLPILRTDDLIRAYRVGENWGDIKPESLEFAYDAASQTYDWQKLTGDSGPLGWGTGKNGGKRARECMLLGLLRPGDLMPTMVRISAASLGVIGNFLKMLVTRGVSYFQCEVELRLSREMSRSGNTYAKLAAPKVTGVLPIEEAGRIHQTFAAMLERAAEDADVESGELE